MLEFPEIICLREQMKASLIGKKIIKLFLLRSEKLIRWGFIDQKQEEFEERLLNATITNIESKNNYLYLDADSNHTLILGDFDGKIVYHPSEDTIPKQVYLRLDFADGTFLTATVKLWGFIKVFTTKDKTLHQQKLDERGIEPTSNDFTEANFRNFVKYYQDAKRTNVKKFITSGKYVGGLGNGYLQEILYRSKLHPRRKLNTLSNKERKLFFHSILDVVVEAIEKGGRHMERDLFDQPGKFIPKLYKDTVGKPCSDCGTAIEKFQFEGGACYICPNCQRI